MSILLIIIGALCIYFGFKFKMFKKFEGQTTNQVVNQLGNSKPSEVVQTGFSLWFRMFGKVALFITGSLFILFGFIWMMLF